MKRFYISVLFLPMTLLAQIPRDIAPLKYWSAPLSLPLARTADLASSEPGVSGQAVHQPAESPANSLVFIGMTPCRVADTRAGFGFSGLFGPPSLVGGQVRAFPIQASTTCTIPSTALAYSFNLTVVAPGFLGYLTVWPVGSTQPNASTLNDALGTVVANAAVVAAGNDSSGSVDVYASNNTDFIIDINGYYALQTGITLTQGSASAPSLSFAGDPATGIYSSSSGTINMTVSGSPALAIGGGALEYTAIGPDALLSNTSGGFDVAVGGSALRMNTTGGSNTALGLSSLTSNTTGNSNTAVGLSAIYSNATGSSNTSIGARALGFSVSGSSNIAVGSQAALNLSGANSNNIDLGSQGASSDNGVTRLGDPAAQSSFFAAAVRTATTGQNNAIPVMIDSNGQLGTVSSSARFKQDIRDMGDASSGLFRLRPVTFRYKQPYAGGSKPLDYGLIAEEVAEVYPDLVVTSAGGQIEAVQYQKLTPMLLNEFRKERAEDVRQQQLVESIETRLAALEFRLAHPDNK